MSDRPAKRARASSNGDSAIVAANPPYLTELAKKIDTLDEKTVRMFLLAAAKESPRVSNLIESESAKIKEIESTEIIDFGYHSKSVWRTLNVDYVKGIKDSRQFEMSGEAVESVRKQIEDIGDRCLTHASYVTKYSALETLRKIGKIIILSSDSTLGREVRESFCEDSILEDTMLDIVNSMTSEELGDLMNEPQEDMAWMDKLKELDDLADGHSIFEGLKDVIQLLEETSDGPDLVGIEEMTSAGEEEEALEV